MKRMRRFWKRLAGTIAGTRRENELAAEIEEHLQSQTEDNIRLGMAPAEARRAALLKFGGVESVKEEYRDRLGLPQIDTLVQDLRFALRSFGKRSAFITVVVLSLAIGIGLNTTIFTWLKAVYLNPLPGVTDARRLVTINAAYKFGDGYSNSFQDYIYIRDHSRLFAGLFAHEMEILALSDGRSVEMTLGGIVSGNYFDVLNTKIALGRGFRQEEDRVLDRDPVIVLSDGLWHRRFGADPGILGAKLELNRVPFTVIGIAAPGFIGVYGGLRQDYWIPLHMARALDPNHMDPLTNGMGLQIMGRPQSGVSISAIQSELDGLSRQIQPLYHKDSPDYRAQAYPLHEAQRGFHSGLFEMVRVLAIAAIIILLLACLNAANLLIGRATERLREISVRISLGASRGRIIRQLLTESFVIATFAGIVGLLIVYATRSVPAVLAPPGMGLYLNLDIDWTVVTFLFAVTVGTSLVFGLLPAFETSKIDVVDSLKEGSGNVTAGRRRAFWRRSLVVGQVALAMTALFGAALFTEYLHEVINANRGFNTKNILTAETDLFAAGLNESRGRVFYRDSVRRLESLPGVESAAWTTFLPMNGSGGSNRRNAEVRGYSAPSGNPLSIIVDTVSPGYLRTLGIPIAKGREFKWSDTQTAMPVLMVNQRFADEYLKGREPIGAEVRIDGTWRSIVGVHRNYVYRDPTQPIRPTILLPMTQDYQTDAIVVVRSKADPSQLLSSLRQVIREFDRNIPVAHVMTMEENVGFHFVEAKVGTAALIFFAVVACTLAAIGIYAVLAAFVNQRRREFGIRIAIGAMPRDVRIKVLMESALMALIGSGIGLMLSVALGELLKSELFTLSPFDPRPYAAAALIMSATVLLSTLAPAWVASRMDPVAALRSE
jgi:predicted permease